jgi:hypothetical protein
MPDEDDWTLGCSPMSEKCSDVVFALKVVPRTKQGILETLLDVNHDESVSHSVTVPPSTPPRNSFVK